MILVAGDISLFLMVLVLVLVLMLLLHEDKGLLDR